SSDVCSSDLSTSGNTNSLSSLSISMIRFTCVTSHAITQSTSVKYKTPSVKANGLSASSTILSNSSSVYTSSDSNSITSSESSSYNPSIKSVKFVANRSEERR